VNALKPGECQEFRSQSNPTKRAAASAPQRLPASVRDGHGRCAIKGNRTTRGEWIYHLPGQTYFHQTRPEELFCSESAAIAAGYRRSRV
jgi:hypothetical protein